MYDVISSGKPIKIESNSLSRNIISPGMKRTSLSTHEPPTPSPQKPTVHPSPEYADLKIHIPQSVPELWIDCDTAMKANQRFCVALTLSLNWMQDNMITKGDIEDCMLTCLDLAIKEKDGRSVSLGRDIPCDKCDKSKKVMQIGVSDNNMFGPFMLTANKDSLTFICDCCYFFCTDSFTHFGGNLCLELKLPNKTTVTSLPFETKGVATTVRATNIPTYVQQILERSRSASLLKFQREQGRKEFIKHALSQSQRVCFRPDFHEPPRQKRRLERTFDSDFKESGNPESVRTVGVLEMWDINTNPVMVSQLLQSFLIDHLWKCDQYARMETRITEKTAIVYLEFTDLAKAGTGVLVLDKYLRDGSFTQGNKFSVDFVSEGLIKLHSVMSIY